MKVFRILFAHNWFAILYFNFKMLPFKQAMKLPFDFYYKVRFKQLSGKVVINSSSIYRGMIKIGAQGSDMFPKTPYIIDIKGKVEFCGRCVLGIGGLLRVEKNGVVKFEENVVLGAINRIFCESSIIIKKDTISSWVCQIMDTDTHSIENLINKQMQDRCKPIVIGERNWIGNNVGINKGTMLPDHTIVASYSLCNKDYTSLSEYSILGGMPAKLIATDRKRSTDKI